jgi:hypothetical protein
VSEEGTIEIEKGKLRNPRTVERHAFPEAKLSKPLPLDIVQPVDVDRLAEAFKKFQEFKQRLLTKDDSVTIAGRQYLKKSAWRKWALACGVSDVLVSYERVPPQGKDPHGNFSYRVIVEAVHKATGRSSIGVAMASRSEKKEWAHEEHDVFTLAHTRSKNRAIADLVGGGEVSAEEALAAEATERKETPVARESRGEMAEPTEPADVPMQSRKYPEVKDQSGKVTLAQVFEEYDGLSFTIKPDLHLDPDSAPIKGFLIPRVLDAMAAKDIEASKPNPLTFDIIQDAAGLLAEIQVYHVGDEKRLREVYNACRWAIQRAAENQTA